MGRQLHQRGVMRRTTLVFSLLVFGCEGSILSGGVIDETQRPGSGAGGGEAVTCAPVETLDPGLEPHAHVEMMLGLAAHERQRGVRH